MNNICQPFTAQRNWCRMKRTAEIQTDKFPLIFFWWELVRMLWFSISILTSSRNSFAISSSHHQWQARPSLLVGKWKNQNSFRRKLHRKWFLMFSIFHWCFSQTIPCLWGTFYAFMLGYIWLCYYWLWLHMQCVYKIANQPIFFLPLLQHLLNKNTNTCRSQASLLIIKLFLINSASLESPNTVWWKLHQNYK